MFFIITSLLPYKSKTCLSSKLASLLIEKKKKTMREQVVIYNITKEELFAHLEGIANNQRIAVPTVQDLPTYLTTQEVCKLLRISTTTLWKWRKKGRLACHKMGARVRYKSEDVLALLETITPSIQ